MTTTRFTNARLIDPETGQESVGELFVKGGVISASASKADMEIDCAGKCLAPGMVDIGVKVCEPGERHKESYASAGRAAAAGGVTARLGAALANDMRDWRCAAGCRQVQ